VLFVCSKASTGAAAGQTAAFAVVLFVRSKASTRRRIFFPLPPTWTAGRLPSRTRRRTVDSESPERPTNSWSFRYVRSRTSRSIAAVHEFKERWPKHSLSLIAK